MEYKPKSITGNEDTLDSRDINDRIEWLQGENRTSEEQDELNDLLYIRDEIFDCYGEIPWEFGVEFINDKHFEEYVKEYYEQILKSESKYFIDKEHANWASISYDLQQGEYMGIAIRDGYFWCREF